MKYLCRGSDVPFGRMASLVDLLADFRVVVGRRRVEPDSRVDVVGFGLGVRLDEFLGGFDVHLFFR